MLSVGILDDVDDDIGTSVDILRTLYAVISMHASADWLQSVHVVFTARRVVSRASVYTVRARVMRSADAAVVCLDITDTTATDVRTVQIVIPRLHDTTGCQTICQTDLTVG